MTFLLCFSFFFPLLFFLFFLGGRGCGRRAAAPRRVRLACSTCKSAVSHRYSAYLLYCYKSTNADATHAQPLLSSSTAARRATAPCRMARKAAAMRRRSLPCAAGLYMPSSYCYIGGLYLSHTTIYVACYYMYGRSTCVLILRAPGIRGRRPRAPRVRAKKRVLLFMYIQQVNMCPHTTSYYYMCVLILIS